MLIACLHAKWNCSGSVDAEDRKSRFTVETITPAELPNPPKTLRLQAGSAQRTARVSRSTGDRVRLNSIAPNRLKCYQATRDLFGRFMQISNDERPSID